jgi:hypothetical protein
MALCVAIFVALSVLPEPTSAEESAQDASSTATQEDALEDRESARKLFREGNGLFERGQYPEALQSYREAVALWDHPAVHFNIAVCLIHLDQPVAAYSHLERSLSQGTEALGSHFSTQATTYEKLLLGRLARLEVDCAQDGAEVSLNGKHLLSCPGKTSQHLLPGEHQLVATRSGFDPLTRALDLRAGETTVESVELSPLEASKDLERRWKPWVPWLPMALGTAAVLGGIGVRALAVSNARQFDREVQRLCPQGCAEETLPESVRQVRSRMAVENGVAISLFATGGLAIVTGAVLLALNRPRAVERNPALGLMVSKTSVSFSLGARFGAWSRSRQALGSL